ncbi:MAG: hypothetical protein HKM00_12075 [Gallionella sp.]|jgi:hypothetical protein|nr:hypothetical protein [Gallionella sp.]
MFEYSNWAVLTVNFVVVLSLALSGVALCAVLHLVNAKWRFEVRHLASSLYALFPLAFVLLLVLLFGGEHTFPWWNGEVTSEYHMPGWYQPHWLVAREVIGMLFMMALYWVFIKRQSVSERSPEDALRFHHVATWIPFFFVLYSTMVAWDFEMTLVPHWHSSMYALQHFISNFGMFLAFLVVWTYVLNTRQRLLRPVPSKIYNYLAQMMLAFTLLWIYTTFYQYLIVWYGNLPEETGRIFGALPGETGPVFGMQNGDYAFLWWSMLTLKFVIPFTSLCFPATRHNPVAINAVAACIITGTLFERYLWIGGINGTGAYPVLAAVLVSGAVATVGYFLVRGLMQRTQLIRGKW